MVIGGTRDVGESNLTVEDAASVIFGYTIMNDWSARDLQGREMKVRLGPRRARTSAPRSARGSSRPTSSSPTVDADGFLAIRAEVYVNGELIGEDLVVERRLAVPRVRRLRVAQLPRRAGRRAGQWHRRQRRLPRRAVGPQRRPRAAAAAGGRRGAHGRRGHRRARRHRRRCGTGTRSPARHARARGFGAARSRRTLTRRPLGGRHRRRRRPGRGRRTAARIVGGACHRDGSGGPRARVRATPGSRTAGSTWPTRRAGSSSRPS